MACRCITPVPGNGRSALQRTAASAAFRSRLADLSVPIASAMPTEVHAPVGIFDSGLGGLSVLRHVRSLLPHEALIYAADSAFAPYGGRDEAWVLARTVAMADFLVAQGVKALVI